MEAGYVMVCSWYCGAWINAHLALCQFQPFILQCDSVYFLNNTVITKREETCLLLQRIFQAFQTTQYNLFQLPEPSVTRMTNSLSHISCNKHWNSESRLCPLSNWVIGDRLYHQARKPQWAWRCVHGHGNPITTFPPLCTPPLPPPSPSPTAESVQWMHPSSALISGLGLCLCHWEGWFPQRLAENNKMLNIPPPCIMAV